MIFRFPHLTLLSFTLRPHIHYSDVSRLRNVCV